MDTSFWQTALLSTFYCVKLFDSSHHLFQWMKKILSTSTNLLLLVPAVSCFLISLPFIWTIHFHGPMNVTEPIRDSDYSLVFSDLFNLLNVAFGCCLPFTLTFACITLSVGSLLKHAWNIRRNALQIRSPPQIGGLLRAAGTMVSCALLDLICCVSVVVEVLEKIKVGDVADTIRWALTALYPTARSVVLIFGNPQFKKQLREMCVFRLSW
ncbi:taste receptor type 2 member 40-like [Lithobates pipiens]